MIKYLNKLWEKWFGKEEIIQSVVGEVLVLQPTPEAVPKPKPLHCTGHKRFKKSCPNCQEIIK